MWGGGENHYYAEYKCRQCDKVKFKEVGYHIDDAQKKALKEVSR